MRDLHLLDAYRVTDSAIRERFGGVGDHGCGAFRVPSDVDRMELLVVASDGSGWDHVSVSRYDRIPTWPEMEQIKRLFFKDDETAMQLHVPPADHVSCCKFCLHLWRPQNEAIPRPSAAMVGPANRPGRSR
jgi:hypothetical protein